MMSVCPECNRQTEDGTYNVWVCRVCKNKRIALQGVMRDCGINEKTIAEVLVTTDIRQTDIEDRGDLRLKALEMADRNIAPETDKRGDRVLRLARRYLKFLEGEQ